MPFKIDQPPRDSFAAEDVMDAAPRIADALEAGIAVTIRPVTWFELARDADTEAVPDIPAETKAGILDAFNGE